MKPLNTLPIENFLEKSRIAIRSNQKHLTLDLKDVQALADCLAMVMTRLVTQVDSELQNIQNQPAVISVNMDGGGFR
jgi:hypothetical protein